MNFRILLAALAVSICGVTYAGDLKTMKNDFIGCTTKENYSSTLSMMIRNDWEAVARVLLSGQCIHLSKGTPVYLEDVSFLSGQVRVRPRGQTSAWWTGSQHVNQ